MVIRSPGQVVSSGHREYGERSGGKECDGWEPVLMCMLLVVTLHNCLEEEERGEVGCEMLGRALALSPA